MSKRAPEAHGEQRSERKYVDQTVGQAPKGMRVEMVMDTTTGTNTFTVQPHSAEGFIEYLELLRPYGLKLGVEFEVKRVRPQDVPSSLSEKL